MFTLDDKPEFLWVIPTLMSLMPGFGQAYNLNVAKAAVFAVLFVCSVGVSVFMPGLGLPVLLLVIFLSVSDAYASAGGRGLFAALVFGVGGLVRGCFALLGLLVWMVLALLMVDSAMCWLKGGTSIVATVNLAGEAAPASRAVDAWLALAIAGGAALLFFFLQGFGRKLIWARSRTAHFMFAVRMLALATTIVGLTGLLACHMEAEAGQALAGRVFGAPLEILRAILASPEKMGAALGKTWPALVPPFVDKGCLAARGLGTAAVASFTTYATIYSLVFLAGLAAVAGLFVKAVLNVSRSLPGYGDWLDFWGEMVKDRTEMMRAEWDSFREERLAAWEQKRQAIEIGRRETARAMETANRRLVRLEQISERIALHEGVELPEAVEALAEEEAGGFPAGQTAGAGFKGLARVAGVTAWGWISKAGKGLGTASSGAMGKMKGGVQKLKEKQAEKTLARQAAKEAAAAEALEDKAKAKPEASAPMKPVPAAATKAEESKPLAPVPAPVAAPALKPAPTPAPIVKESAKEAPAAKKIEEPAAPAVKLATSAPTPAPTSAPKPAGQVKPEVAVKTPAAAPVPAPAVAPPPAAASAPKPVVPAAVVSAPAVAPVSTPAVARAEPFPMVAPKPIEAKIGNPPAVATSPAKLAPQSVSGPVSTPAPAPKPVSKGVEPPAPAAIPKPVVPAPVAAARVEPAPAVRLTPSAAAPVQDAPKDAPVKLGAPKVVAAAAPAEAPKVEAKPAPAVKLAPTPVDTVEHKEEKAAPIKLGASAAEGKSGVIKLGAPSASKDGVIRLG